MLVDFQGFVFLRNILIEADTWVFENFKQCLALGSLMRDGLMSVIFQDKRHLLLTGGVVLCGSIFVL